MTENVEQSKAVRSKRKPFVQIPNDFLRNPSLSIGAKVLYAILLGYQGTKERAYPGQARLAEELGISEASVRKCLAELKQANLIKVTRRGQGKQNLYQVSRIGD